MMKPFRRYNEQEKIAITKRFSDYIKKKKIVFFFQSKLLQKWQQSGCVVTCPKDNCHGHLSFSIEKGFSFASNSPTPFQNGDISVSSLLQFVGHVNTRWSSTNNTNFAVQAFGAFESLERFTLGIPFSFNLNGNQVIFAFI